MWRPVAMAAMAVVYLFLPQGLASAGERIWRAECHADRAARSRVCEVIGEFGRSNPYQVLTLIYDVGERRFLHAGHPASSRVGVRVDVHESIDLYLCTAQACLVRGKDAQRLLQQMRTGATLEINLVADSLSRDTVTISLEGFDAVYQRALKDFGNDSPVYNR